MTYNIHRWYGSGWGRYTQADALGLAAGVNVYSDADSAPVENSDPFGQAVVRVTKVDEKTYMRLADYKKTNPCSAPGSFSCTERLLEDFGCPCSCKGTGWGMDVQINVEVRYHLAGVPENTTHPPATYFSYYRQHEDRNFADLKTELQKYADQLESQRFTSEEGCNRACGQAIGGFRQWLNNWAVDSNRRIDQGGH